MKIYFSLILMLLGLVAYGQNSTSGSSAPTSKADFASKSVFDRLALEIAKRSGHADDLGAIGRKPLRVVFLVDSSQNSVKDYLPPFEGKVVSGILRRLGNAQIDERMSDDGLDDISIYPYQLKLIADAQWAVKSKLLKKGEGTVQSIITHIPSRRIPVPGEGPLGHDSSGARAALIKELGLADGPRSTVIIQISPTSVNSDPGNAANNKKITEEDARVGGLKDTDYVAYDDEGRYYQTDPPGNGVAPSDVHIWTYGPAKYDVPARTDGGEPTAAAAPVQAQSSDGPPIVLFIILGIFAMVVIYFISRFIVKIPVEMDGEIRKVGFTSPIAIVTAGGTTKTGENSLHISPEHRGNVGEGLKVGQITVPLMAGGPRISGGGGHTLYLNNSSKSEHPLGKKSVNVSFGKGDSRTELISFKTK